MPKRTKIAIPLINLSSHGGIRIIVELSNFLSKAGNSVTFIIPKGKISTTYHIDPNVKIVEIGPLVKNKYLSYFLYLLLLPFYCSKYDVLVANFFPTYYPALLGSKISRAKFFYFVQGIETTYKSPLSIPLNLLCRTTYISAAPIIAANGFLRDTLFSRFQIKVKNINIGLSSIFFESPPLKEEKKYDLIYFLRHEPWKRRHLFYEITTILRASRSNLKILCVSQDDALLREALEFGMVAHKPSDDTDLIHTIDKAKVMLLTSSYEGFGLPPLECMARGLPAVTFDCGGPSVYIRNGENSFIVETASQAANLINELLDDENFRKRIGAAAMSSAENFKNEVGFRKFIDLISS